MKRRDGARKSANGGDDVPAGNDARAGNEVPELAGALAGEVEKLSHCVHCGFCLPVCPTYTRLGDEADSPRGRLYLMRAVVEGRLDAGSAAFQTHIDRCLGCRACEPVCPSGVEYGHLLERARQAAVTERPPTPAARILLSTMGYPMREALFMAFSRLFRGTGIPGLAARGLPSGGWIGRLRVALSMLAASGPAEWSARERGPSSRATDEEGSAGAPGATGPEGAGESGTSAERRRPEAAAAPSKVRVGILEGCVQEGLFSRVNRATVRVLEANGFELVPVRSQSCCGALHAHGGMLERARELARRNTSTFLEADVDVVVVNAAGCGSTMKDYGELLEDDPEWADRAREIAGRVRDVSEILADAGPRVGGEVSLRVAYDPPCHLLHAQRVDAAPRQMLAAIPGLETVPLADAEECCGGAGIYGLTHPDLGGRIGGDKVTAVIESEAEVVATGNPGCIMQIGAGLRMAGEDVDVVHPVELLDESYRRAGFYD